MGLLGFFNRALMNLFGIKRGHVGGNGANGHIASLPGKTRHGAGCTEHLVIRVGCDNQQVRRISHVFTLGL